MTDGRDAMYGELGRGPIDVVIAGRGRCADPRSSLTGLFFSEDLMDIARAKAICVPCAVRELCLSVAVERREPVGVWGGELIRNGEVTQPQRGRGRPPKVSVVTAVDEVNGQPVLA